MEARRREQERREERREARAEPTGRGAPEYGVAFGARDLIHWGPVWAGVIGGIATMILLALLGLAVGLSAIRTTPTPTDMGTPGAIWGAIAMILAFFVGGWLAGRTYSHRGSTLTAFFQGSMVWALTVVLAVFLASLGVAGVLGTALDAFGPNAFGAAPGPDAVGVAQRTAIGTFITLIIAYVASVGGAYLGAKSMVVEER